jgi:hypothetical protein
MQTGAELQQMNGSNQDIRCAKAKGGGRCIGICAGDHNQAGGNPRIAGIVPGKQSGQCLLIEFAESYHDSIGRRTGAGDPLDQVETGSRECPLEPVGAGGRLTREENSGIGWLRGFPLAHAGQRSK